MVKTVILPHVGGRYRVTDERHRIFEGIVRSISGDFADLEVTAGKSHYLKSIDTPVGELVAVRTSRCSFERL